MVNLLYKPFIIAGLGLLLTFGLLPQEQQKTDLQANVFTGAVITTTTQSEVVACGQQSGSIGRKTLVVENDAASDGTITVTVELREDIDGSDFTSGYMANNVLAAGAITYTAKTPSDDIAARFCNISAVSASTSTITVTFRKE